MTGSIYTFNWTDLRETELVGFSGEDLKVDGVTFEGNLVHLDGGHTSPSPREGWIKVFSIYGTQVWVKHHDD